MTRRVDRGALHALMLLLMLASATKSSGLKTGGLSSRATAGPAATPSLSYWNNDIVWKNLKKAIVTATIIVPSLFFGSPARADDELANYAAQGNAVGVDGQCFIRKCALETSKCANDPNCFKGLSCLAKCKGGSLCSTACFAKYGSEHLDAMLYCSVEKNDCVHVPKEGAFGWKPDTKEDIPALPMDKFSMSSMEGTWFKVMGLDSRYDCFDCQKNTFHYIKDKNVLDMEAVFRIPKPSGYMQNRIREELQTATEGDLANMRSNGKMFGLSFWENWYVLGESTETSRLDPLGILPSAIAGTENSDLKLIFYTGHTLQGNYKGAFVYAKTPTISGDTLQRARSLIKLKGLDPTMFCMIRNQCYLDDEGGGAPTTTATSASGRKDDASKAEEQNRAPFWYLGQTFFQTTRDIASELADWFEDPALLSDWLVSQQERMITEQPLAVSPFAAEGLFRGDESAQ